MKGFILSDKISTETIPPYVIFTDTETVEGENGSLSLLLGYYQVWKADEKGLPLYQADSGYYTSEAGFYSVISRYLPSRCVAHNWQFDASVLRVGSRENMNYWGYDIDINNGIYPVGGQGYAPFLLSLKFDKGICELICNTNFYKMPLSRIGDSFGIKKLEMPEAELSDTMREYCKRDVEILRDAWFAVFAYTQRIADTTPGITTAMAANRVFRKAFYTPRKKVQGTQHIPYINDAERAAYHGGRTDTFYKGIPESETLYKYDVNSLYPSCMIGEIPVRYSQRGNKSHIVNPPAGMTALANVRLSIPPESQYGFLGIEGIVKDGQLMFPVGEFDCWIWQPISEICVQQDYVNKIHNVLLYESENIFDSYIHQMFAYRQEFKKAGNFAFDMLTKLLMNSLYGKFAQRKNSKWREAAGYEYHIMAEYDSEGMRRFSEIWNEVETEYWQIKDRLYAAESYTGELSQSAVCSIAGYITATGRAVLWNAMAAMLDKGANLYMCDTDSIVADMELPPEMVSDSELGKWKLEEVVKGCECEFTAPKHYLMRGKLKLKGVRNPQLGATQHPQTVFPAFMTDLLSFNSKRRAALENGPALRHIVKTPTGTNTKRRETGYNRPTLPYVLGL